MTAIICIIMVFFPFISLSAKSRSLSEATATNTATTESEAVTEAAEEAENINLLRVSGGKVIELEMFDYLVGAVAAEMPASFHKQALMAQTVACYSYAMWIKENADNAEGVLYDISDNPSVHQGYLDNSELKEKWGDDYSKNLKIIKDAVNSVMGEYLAYNNEAAMCIYHAISAGETQSAEDAWGSDISYLQSVTATGDTLSPDTDSSVSLTFSEIEKKLEAENVSEKGIKTKTSDSGYVTSVTVGSKTLSGIEAASLLGLKSPCFTVKKAENGYTFTVKGKGHGIGMSQYSAQYMARQGSDYKEILAHFYPGTELVTSV